MRLGVSTTVDRPVDGLALLRGAASHHSINVVAAGWYANGGRANSRPWRCTHPAKARWKRATTTGAG
jgi:hypothetical protein